MVLPVHSIQHFNGYKYRQSHRHGMRICEDLAINAFEFIATTQARQVMSLEITAIIVTMMYQEHRLIW